MKLEQEEPPRPASDQGRSPEALALKLLGLLRGVSENRRLTPEERRRLLEWVTENRRTEVAAVGFLIETLQEIVASGTVTASEFIDLYFALERVLPVTPQRLSEEARRWSLPPPAPLAPITGEVWARPESAASPVRNHAPDSGWHGD